MLYFRIVRPRGRNPVAVALLTVVAAAVVLAIAALGLVLLAGLAVVGGVVLLARRAFGRRPRRPGPAPVLDPANEVFASRADAGFHRSPVVRTSGPTGDARSWRA